MLCFDLSSQPEISYIFRLLPLPDQTLFVQHFFLFHLDRLNPDTVLWEEQLLSRALLSRALLSLSLLVSYTRARGEGLGVDLKGKGIAERAERILIIAILGFIPFSDNMSVALWIISILSAITVLERLKVVSAKLGMPLFSVQTFRDMFQRNHDFDGSSAGTMTSRLNEPPTSLSKLTKKMLMII